MVLLIRLEKNLAPISHSLFWQKRYWQRKSSVAIKNHPSGDSVSWEALVKGSYILGLNPLLGDLFGAKKQYSETEF